MFMAFMVVLLVVSVPLCGGRLSGLAALRLRGAPWLILALLVQIVITGPLADLAKPVLVGCHLATYAMAGAMVWMNRRVPGLLVLAAGALSNAAVIALNGGTLPASATALADAGWHQDAADFANSGVLAHPVLPWLGDVVATPAWLPFRNVISVGDILILLGALVILHAAGGSRPWRWVADRRRSAVALR